MLFFGNISHLWDSRYSHSGSRSCTWSTFGWAKFYLRNLVGSASSSRRLSTTAAWGDDNPCFSASVMPLPTGDGNKVFISVRMALHAFSDVSFRSNCYRPTLTPVIVPLNVHAS
jgi:hypothetical protein